MVPTASELFDASIDQVRRGRVRQALRTLLDALAADPGHTGAMESAGRICHLLGAEQDARLFRALAERPTAPDELYALGYRMVEQDRPDVGAALLASCLQREPDHPSVRRELAYARFQNRDFTGCLETLEPLLGGEDLSETELLDVQLLQSEAWLYARDRERSRQILAQADAAIPDDDQRQRLDALHAQLGRSLHFDTLDGLGLREWHFIQHAGVILKVAGGFIENAGHQGRFDVLTLRPDMVAFLLQRLLHLMERLGLTHEIVLPASPIAAPLAHALGQRAGWDVGSGPEDRAGRAGLLVAASAGELEPLAAGLARHRSDLHLFAFNLDWERDAVVCPELTGVCARRVLLPWEPQYAMNGQTGQTREVVPDDRTPDQIGAELVGLMDSLPDDEGRARKAFESIYVPWAGELVVGNPQCHPYRRRFTRLSPCWASGEDAAES